MYVASFDLDQHTISIACACGCLHACHGQFFKLVNAGLIVALSLFSLIAPFFISELNTVDSNTGFRLILWRDTWSALIDTYGLGVGYGTEYISNDFTHIHDRYWKITPEDADDRLFVGTHSTFYDIALRNGILGLMLFATWFLRTIFQAPKNSPQNAKLFYATAALLIVNNAVNMGFTSMSFCLGTGACLGFLHYLRQRENAAREGIIAKKMVGPVGLEPTTRPL